MLILRVAVALPLRRYFDYLPKVGLNREQFKIGVRLKVPFGPRTMLGILIEIVDQASVEEHRLKPIIDVLDSEPLFSALDLKLLCWVSHYYHHPIGDVLSTALPSKLRKGEKAKLKGEKRWQLTELGAKKAIEGLSKQAKRQIQILELLQQHPTGLSSAEIQQQLGNCQPAIKALQKKACLQAYDCYIPPTVTDKVEAPFALQARQQQAVTAILSSLDKFQCFLLDGVTGSGKTEVYLHIVAKVIELGLQALILVPEIGLTPQLLGRFQRRFQQPIAALHSGLSDQERLTAWMMAKQGKASIVIGTRSAVFVPLQSAGVFIVDEEHDISFKQQEGLRYSARDIAIKRAHQHNIPIILGSATPSLESMHNANKQKYQYLHLPKRAGNAKPPEIELLDMKQHPMKNGFSTALLKTIAQHLGRDEQVLLFLNRRGYAPRLICRECGWLADCPQCDAHMTLHHQLRKLSCHHCGFEQKIPRTCPQCESLQLVMLGQGTERIEETLTKLFPNNNVARIDRDTTRKKGVFEQQLKDIHANKIQLLIGTQMLAKGHHFPNVTLVGILDADQGLLGVDFRSAERLAQLILQVAGRAGREQKIGKVLIQTYYAYHSFWDSLLYQGYHRFCELALEERQQAQFPPFAVQALLRAESTEQPFPMDFLNQARYLAEQYAIAGIEYLGPVPSPMERRGGWYRAQLLVQAKERRTLHQLLAHWIIALEKMKKYKVRWSIDIDPLEMF